MSRRFPLILLSLLLFPAFVHAAEMSLVDRVMSILGKGNLPRIEVRPKTVTTEPAGPPLPPPRAGVEIARNFLPVYSLERGAEDDASVLPFFASGPVTQSYADATTLLIMLPDDDREAAKAFAYARAAQDEAIARKPEWMADGTYIFAPQFLTPDDVATHASIWPDGGKALLRWVSEGWVWGQESAADFSMQGQEMWAQKRGLSSYTVMDYILLMLITPQRFPHLQRVVIAGTGAGADFAQRYAVLGIAPDMLMEDGLEVRFVVAGAHSYLYLDKNRALKKPFGQYGDDAEVPAFNEVGDDTCRPVNLYPFGLDGLPAYGRRQGANELRLRFGSRRVIYLQSSEAVDPITDTTPEACAMNLQGGNLKERARTYYASLDRLYGEELARSQRMYMLPKLGTDSLTLWRHPCGMAALFGDGGCTADTLVTFGNQ